MSAIVHENWVATISRSSSIVARKTRGPVFDFDLTGLKWEAPEVVSSGRSCRGTFDCPVTEKCDKTAKPCGVSESINEHGNCADADR